MKLPEPTPFQKFDTLMRHVISVPKAELEKRDAEWKAARAKKKK